MSAELHLTKIKLGDNADTSKNFVISVPAVADGTLTIERENGTDVLTIDVNGKVTCILADGSVTQTNLAAAVLPIGVGQTWQNMRPSRVSGTVYTNSTGRPIMVNVAGGNGAGSTSFTPVVGGVSIGGQGTSSSGESASVCFLVPNATTYSVTAGADAHITVWTELR